MLLLSFPLLLSPLLYSERTFKMVTAAGKRNPGFHLLTEEEITAVIYEGCLCSGAVMSFL
jgi:hypothetical protein